MSREESLYWEYQGIIRFMEEYPSTYGLETKRSNIHKEILSHYPEELHDKITDVLHDLKSDMLFIDFLHAITH